MANYTKITYYSIKKAIKNLINGFIHGANKSREKKVINRAAKNDTIQIVAIQQADGSFHELKTERNKDLSCMRVNSKVMLNTFQIMYKS